MGAEVSIEGEHPEPLEIDGTYVGEGSLLARVLPGDLGVLVPER